MFSKVGDSIHYLSAYNKEDPKEWNIMMLSHVIRNSLLDKITSKLQYLIHQYT